MNLQQSPTVKIKSPTIRYKRQEPLEGRWLILVRVLWIVLVALILVIFIASIPTVIGYLHTACASPACRQLIPPYTEAQYEAAGFSTSFVLIYIYTLAIFFSLVFLAIGAILFWLRSRDFMALYASFALVAFALSFNARTWEEMLPGWLLLIQTAGFQSQRAPADKMGGAGCYKWGDWLPGCGSDLF